MNKVLNALGSAALASGILLASAGAAQAATQATESTSVSMSSSAHAVRGLGAMAPSAVDSSERADIYRVWGAECDYRTDFFKTWSSTGNTCWAQPGEVSVKLYKVTKVTSGNNYGYYVTDKGKVYYFNKFETDYHLFGVNIVKIKRYS